MQQYLTKINIHEGNYVCVKENAICKDKFAQKQLDCQFGKLEKGNCKKKTAQR